MILTLKELNLFLLFEEPLDLPGRGDYALTDVKEMDGTKEFLDWKCKNDKTVFECKNAVMQKYLEIGKNECKCIPHNLRTSHKTVSHLSISLAPTCQPNPNLPVQPDLNC